MNVRNSMLIAVGAALLLVAAGCSSTRPAGDQVDDAALTSKVKGKLAADPDINPFNIDVDTMDGVVTLRGEVEKEFAAEEAERLALATAGVRDVRNEIRVQPEPGEDDETLSDAAITVRIKAKLTADPEINPFNVDVDTLDGHVTLTGVVASDTARSEIERHARETDGVMSVINRLEVRDPTS